MLRSEWQSYINQHAAQPEAAQGVCYLPELGVLRFSGADVANFLQGYLTCDTLDLAPSALTPMAVCSIKGRVVVNGWCHRAPDDSISLIAHRSLTARMVQFFKPYSMFSKTKFTDVSDATLLFGDRGVAACELNVAADCRLSLIDDLSDAKTLWERHPHIACASWWLGLIEARIPLLSETTSEAFLPQMLDLERLGAVDFNKGCYLGQEVVARAQHRGEVKRRLQRLDWSGPVAPEAGAQFGAIAAPSQNLGTIINSATHLDTADAGACLAVVANDAAGPFQLHDTVLNRVG